MPGRHNRAADGRARQLDFIVFDSCIDAAHVVHLLRDAVGATVTSSAGSLQNEVRRKRSTTE